MGGEGRGGKGGGEHPGLVVESRRASPQPLLTLVASSAGSVGVAHTLSLLADTLAGAGVLGGASLGGHGASLCGYTGGEETSLAGVVVRADRVNLRAQSARTHRCRSSRPPSDPCTCTCRRGPSYRGHRTRREPRQVRPLWRQPQEPPARRKHSSYCLRSRKHDGETRNE